MPRYSTEFIPQAHLSEDELPQWLTAMQEKHLPAMFKLTLLRRRGQWIVPMPAAVWGSTEADFGPLEELNARLALEQRRRTELGSYGFTRSRDVVFRDGVYFYRDAAISALAPYLAVPVLAKALVRLIHHLEVKRVKPNILYSDRPPKKPEQRVATNGQRLRGPTWTEFEDYVVRKWFSRHTAGPHIGKHAKLTDAQWASVLEELKGQRRKTDVLRRIKLLNQRLRMSLTVNGYVTRTNVMRYKCEALGETEVRIPHARAPLRQYDFSDDGN